MTQVDIEYCVPCGHLDRAIELQRHILEEFGRDIDSVSLTTGDGGVFVVRVDDELVFDKSQEGYDVAAILERLDGRATAQ